MSAIAAREQCDALEQSVRHVADKLKLYGRKDLKADPLLLLRNFPGDEGKVRRLVMLDNADGSGFLIQPPITSDEPNSVLQRIDYVPTSDPGSVMITMRSKREALRLGHVSETVEVLPMSVAEAKTLLRDNIGWCRMRDRFVRHLYMTFHGPFRELAGVSYTFPIREGDHGAEAD
ncbi:hypothetical protein KC316_g3536 [Hortaea werneckii]|nr:hypothetical protein KC316_g3536 [Hortaea werneckii]